MHYHPDLAAAIAEARDADLRDAATRARHATRDNDKRHGAQRLPSTGSIQLDAYPRLCGLPVTIDRLTTNGATARSVSDDVAPAESATGRPRNAARPATRSRRQPMPLWRRRVHTIVVTATSKYTGTFKKT
jgi:hypothetical protein